MIKRGTYTNKKSQIVMQRRRCVDCGKTQHNSKQEEQEARSLKVCLQCPLEHCVEELRPGENMKWLDLSIVSRVEVAQAVHCVPEHISGIFTGKTNVSLPLAYDIAKYLGTTVDCLYQAISGANGVNPRRKYRITYRDYRSLIPKYSVDGKGYPNLREALLATGIELRCPTHYDILPDNVKARIVRNRACRGR